MKIDSLRGRSSFSCIYNSGNKFQGRFFILLYTSKKTGELACNSGDPCACEFAKCDNLECNCKIGIVVSRKVGNAVKRNYIKRCVREFVRSINTDNDFYKKLNDFEIIIIAKRRAAERKFLELSEDFFTLVSKIKKITT